MLNGVLYICGGSELGSSCERYVKGWQTLPSMNCSRYNHAVESMNGRYVDKQIFERRWLDFKFLCSGML